MRHNPGLKVADVVRGVVHELRVPDAAVVRLLEPFQLHLKEVEPFDVHHDGRLPSAVRCLYISSSEGASEPMLRHHLVHPSQTLKMVPIKFARLGRARGGQNALRIPAQDRPVGHVRQAGDRKRPRAHGVCQLVVRWRFRCDPCHAPMRVDIDGNRLTQDFERGRRGFGGLGSGCRTSRPNSAGEHRADRSQRRTPHPLSRHESVSLTTAIHAVLPENAPGNIASHVRPLLSPSSHQPAGAAGARIIQCSSLGRTAALAQERNKPGEVCWHPVPSFSTEWPIRWDPTV